MQQAQIDPAIYDQILNAGNESAGLDPEIAHQQMLAEMLRKAGASPQMRMSGRIAAAPSGMEYLGALMNQGMAGQKDMHTLALQRQQQGLRSQQTNAVLQFLKRQQGYPQEVPTSPFETNPQAGP